jgi:tetratricopeptide (TPR) repeat protein
MSERDAGELRYTAFLSYSHKDAAAAGRLHRRLETYKLPKRLIGKETPRGPVPERLWPIFRDRDELPAATDLSETVKEALAQSGALIVLCSPHAAGSLWVAEEIQVFRALHPDRPILAAVLDADPPECFPAALRAFGEDGTWHEPLATDLRRHCDGPNLGLLKLVAGITGVGLDALVQRDATRRVRRVTAVTAMALIAMLIMGGLALAAWDARREAERQGVEAEGQIEFMVTDLRARLKDFGSVEIRRAVNRHALGYYARQDLDSLSPDSLQRRARLLHLMGEDDAARGNLSAALAWFSQAHRTTGEQLARDPDNPERIYAHSQSAYYIGSIAQQRADYAAALTAYRGYLEQAQRMNLLAPGNPRYVGELAYAHNNIGSVLLNGLTRPAAARAQFRQALHWFERAAQLEPGNRDWIEEAADAHSWIATSFFTENRFAEARREHLIEQRMKLRLLRMDPANRAYLYAAVIPTRSLARVDIETRDFGRAQRLLGEARSTMAGLLAFDAENVAWRDQATMIELDVAKIFIATGRPGEARAALANARGLLERSAATSGRPSGDRGFLLRRVAELSHQIDAMRSAGPRGGS